MNILPTLLAAIIGVHPLVDVTSNDKELGSQAWESHGEGVSVALSLRPQMDEGAQAAGFITIYVKNTSNTPKRCFIDSADLGFQIFTRNAEGSWQALHDYHPRSIQAAGPIVIDPNHTMSHIIELSSDDLAIVKTRSVKCRIDIVNVTTGQEFKIESSPRILTETSSG